MFTQCKAELIINKVDNGYTLKWEKEKAASEEGYFGPAGFEILKTQEELLARIAAILK